MKYVKILLIGIILIFGVSGILLIPRKIIVAEIECEAVGENCSDYVNSLLEREKNKSYFLAKKNVFRALSNNSKIQNFSVTYKFPNGMMVTLLEKKPRFVLKSVNSDKWVSVDKEGFVIGENEKADYPSVFTGNNLKGLGQKVSDKEYFALQIIESCYLALQIKTGVIESDSLAIELPSGPRVIFPLEGDRDILVGSLILIQNELNNDKFKEDKELAGEIKTIDLRFKNPVLVKRAQVRQ